MGDTQPLPDSHRDVVISHTGEDLAEYRDAAFRAIEAAQLVPRGLEPTSPLSIMTIRQSLLRVDQAELFIGLFGPQYGSIPYGYDMCVAEMEFRHAARRGIPVFIFMPDEAANIPAPSDTAKLDKLKVLEKELRSKYTIRTFKDPADLEKQVSEILASQEVQDYLVHTDIRQTQDETQESDRVNESNDKDDASQV